MAESLRTSVPIAEELAAIGLPVRTVGDQCHQRFNYEAAFAILLRWLPRVKDPVVKEEIVRALAVKWERPLIEEFRRAEDPNGFGIRWTIGNALSVIADDSVFDDIVDLATDRSYGRTRAMLVEALANMGNPRAVDVLIELLSDEEVAGRAVVALRKLKPPKARPYLERFLTHPTTSIRNEAKHALKNIDRQMAKRPKTAE